MSRTAEFSFKEHKKMFAGLDKLDKKFRQKTIVKAAREAGKPIRSAMRTRAPKATGLLKISIAIKSKGFPRSRSAAAIVGPKVGVKGKKADKIRQSSARASKAEPANYAHLVEEKTKPHTIRPTKRGGVLMFGGVTIRGAVKHPGTRGRKFMKRAMKATRRAAFAKAIDTMQAAIKAEAVR